MFLPWYNKELVSECKSCVGLKLNSRRLFQPDCDYMIIPYGAIPGELGTLLYTALKLKTNIRQLLGIK